MCAVRGSDFSYACCCCSRILLVSQYHEFDSVRSSHFANVAVADGVVCDDEGEIPRWVGGGVRRNV